MRAGLRRGRVETDLDTGIRGLPELDPTIDTSVQLRAIYDTRDSVSVPTSGTFISTRYLHAEDWLDGKFDYDLLEGVVSHSFNFLGNSLSLTAGGGTKHSGDLSPNEEIQIGGIRTFPGLRPGELRGTSYWYAGLRLQAGEMHDRFDGIDEGTLYGISGSIRGRTPVGPFKLSLGFVDNGSRLIQFSIGRAVGEGSILDELY